MKILSMRISKRWADHILAGRKTIEGRVMPKGGQLHKVKEGGFIRLQKGYTRFSLGYTVVERTKIYNNFKEMCEQEGYTNCVPNVECLDDAVETYTGISKKYANATSVLAIQMRKCTAAEEEKARALWEEKKNISMNGPKVDLWV
tara:strand:+ start:70 stop:504 length:435 start_codon:yes stop_codon:yes gene_type:complete